MQKLTIELLLNAYAGGYFPMAEDRDSDELNWYYPERRGIIPLDHFHVPKSLAKLVKKKPFTITTDKVFPEVIRACAEDAPNRPETWINSTIIDLYCELWEKGFAHSVECWDKKTLVGGLYGVALGGAFFGESMFSRASGASKIALVELVSLLKGAGYQLLDTQFVNDHLMQFGVVEIPRDEYLGLLKKALPLKPTDCF
jgi:leucyl/phenylalanyl-tRNA---protein transferase